MDPYELGIRRELGLPIEEERAGGFPDLLQPIRTFFGATQGVIPRALSGLFPETYAKAQEEQAKRMGVTAETPWYERVEAAPGAGSVGVAALPEETRQSAVGRAVLPAAEMVGNILGDPTTYTPAILGKAANLIAKGSKAGAEALGAIETAKRTAPLLAGIEAAATGMDAAQAARYAREAVAGIEGGRIASVTRALAAESPLRARAYLAAETVKAAEPYAIGGAAAIGYGPGVVEGAIDAGNRVREAIGEGNVEEALVSGANLAFMAGIGGLMGKGLLDTASARRAIARKLADDGVIPASPVEVGEPVAPLPRSGTREQLPQLAAARNRVAGPGFEMGERWAYPRPGEPDFVGPEAPLRPLEELRREEVLRRPPEAARPEATPEEIDALQVQARGLEAIRREQPPLMVGDEVRGPVEPAPLPPRRPLAPRARRGRGRQGELPFEGEGVGRTPTARERADQKLRDAFNEEEAQYDIDAEVQALMGRDLSEQARGKMTPADRQELNRLNAAFKAGSGPEWEKWKSGLMPYAIDRVRRRYEAQIKVGLDPVEILREKRYSRLEREGIEAPGESPTEITALAPTAETPPAAELDLGDFLAPPGPPRLGARPVAPPTPVEATGGPLRPPRRPRKSRIPVEKPGIPVRTEAVGEPTAPTAPAPAAALPTTAEVPAVPAVPRETAAVPAFVPKNVEQALADLGYSAEARRVMAPEEAQRILAEQRRAPNAPVAAAPEAPGVAPAGVPNARPAPVAGAPPAPTAGRPDMSVSIFGEGPAVDAFRAAAERTEGRGRTTIPEVPTPAAGAPPERGVAPAAPEAVPAAPAAEAAAPPAAAPAALPAGRKPTTPQTRAQYTPAQWADSFIRHAKAKGGKPEELDPLRAKVEKAIPEAFEALRKTREAEGLGWPPEENVLRAEAHRVGRQVLNMAREKVPAEGAVPLVEEAGGVATAVDRGEAPARGPRGPHTPRETYEGPGGLPKAELERQAKARGKGLSEPAQRFIAGMEAARKGGLTVEDALKPFREAEGGKGIVLQRVPNRNWTHHFNDERATEAALYLNAFDRLKGDEERFGGNLGAVRTAALKEANEAAKAMGIAKELPAFRNDIGLIEKAIGQHLVAMEAERRGVKLPEKVAEAPRDLEVLKGAKAGLDERAQGLVERVGKGEQLDPAEVGTFLKDYAAYKELTPKRAMGRREAVALGDGMLRLLAEKAGVQLYKGIKTEEVLRRVAKAVGLNYDELVPRKAPAAPVVKAVGAEPRAVSRLPEEWTPVPDRPGEARQGRWKGPNGTVVTPLGEKGLLEVVASADPDKLALDLKTLVDSGKAQMIRIGGDKVPKGWDQALDRLYKKNPGLFSYETDRNGSNLLIVNAKPGEAHDIALMAHEADENLSYTQRKLRAEEYGEDAANGVDIGDGQVVAAHDRVQDRAYSLRTAELGRETARVAGEVTKELADLLGPKTPIVFKGLTTSPYARGLYVGTPEASHVFANLADVVYASKTPKEAAENLAHALIHEVSHLADTEHKGVRFTDTEDYIEQLVKAQGIYDDMVSRLEKSFGDRYERIKGELGGEHVEARRQLNRESWRARAAEAEAGIPARAAEGRLAPEPNLTRGGEAAAAGGGGAGVQRGGAVLRSSRGPAGGLRPGAADRGAAAAGPAEGGAARPEAWSDSGPREAQIARLETEPTPDEAEAAKLIGDLQREKQIKLSKVEDVFMADAQRWGMEASDAEIAAELRRRPDPRGKEGVWPGALNTLVGMEGVSDRSLAAVSKYLNLRKEAGLAESSRPRKFEEVKGEVLDLLGIHTPAEYVQAFRSRGGGLDDTGELLLTTIRDEYVRKGKRLEKEFEEATLAGKQQEAAKIYMDYVRTRRNGAAAAGVLADRLTGTARGLAEARWRGLLVNPAELQKVVLRANIDEMLRSRIGDKAVRAEKVEELLRAMDEVKAGQMTGPEFTRMLRAVMKKPGLFGPRVADWRDKFLEFYKAGLLGWPSEAANALSNAGFRGTRYLEDALASVFDAGFHAAGLSKERAIFIEEAGIASRALRRSLAQELPEFGKRLLKLIRLEGGDVRERLQSGAMIQDLGSSMGAIAGKKGNFFRFHFDSMQNFDTLFKGISRDDTLYRELYRGLKSKSPETQWIRDLARPGEKPVDFVERVAADITDNYGKMFGDLPFDEKLVSAAGPIWDKAVAMARQDTFQARLGSVASGMHAFLTSHPMSGLLIPFFRTPTNILKETLSRTPWGVVQALTRWSKLSQAERMQALAKPTVGSMIGAFAGLMALNGEITGGGPLSFEEKEALQATGWQPYSVRVGNQWLSYQRLEPLSSLLGMAADAVEAYRRGDMATGSEMFQKVADSASENMLNKTFWSGLSALTGATSDPKRNLAQFVKQMEGSLVPNSVGYVPAGHLTRAIDPVYRQQDNLWSFDPLPEPMLAKIPFLSQTLAPSYGPTGEPRERPGSAVERALSPFARRTVETGPMADGAQELVRVGAVPKPPMRQWTSPQGFKVPLKPEERQLLARGLREATTLIGQRLVRDPFYQSLPKDEEDPRYVFGQKTQQQMVKQILGKYRDRALKRVMPSLKERVRQTYRQQREEA